MRSIFYLRTRGIGTVTCAAQMLIQHAFAGEIINL